jgi:tetratricopeptide (TPR) repeat protein
MIAYHYARTEEHGEAAEWLERAGDRAAGVYANETALDNYEGARKRLELSGAAPIALAQVGEKLGGVLATLNRYDEALEVLERTVEVFRDARDLEAVARVTALIGWTHRYRGTPQEGIARIQPVLDLVTWSGPSEGLASLHLALAYLHFGSGKYHESVEAAERAEELARAAGDGQTLGGAMMRRGTALTLVGQMEEGVKILEDSIPLLEAAGDLSALAIGLNNLAANYQSKGELKAAWERGSQALATHERVGNTASIGFVDLGLGEINVYMGEWEEAEVSIERGGTVLQAVGASWYAPFAPLHRGHLSIRQGRWDEAPKELKDAIALAEPIGELQALDTANWLLSELEIREGRPRDAVNRLDLQMAQNGPFLAALLTNRAWGELALGDVESASETIKRAQSAAEEQNQRLQMPDILRVQGMIFARQERWEEAHAAFLEAISMARVMPYPYVEGCALYEQGLAYAEQGEAEKGERCLNAALEIFSRIGALKDVELTELELGRLNQPAARTR